MAPSKSTRIMILLGIDTAFFFLELIVGYAVHSLALVADSFHMLNDVISLLVGLWAVKVANQRTNSKQYTYGWQRAETLGALINGVFLVALCLSIFLEAIQRFVEPQEVSHPKIILIVGSFGLASNIVGLFLFHDHGHGHSHGGHSHGHDEHSHAEEGHSHDHGIDAHDHAVADEGGNVADVLPQNRVGFPSTVTRTPQSDRRRSSFSGKKAKRHHRSQSRNYSTLDEIYVHPSSFRNSIIESSRARDNDEADDEEDSDDAATDVHPTEHSPLLAKSNGHHSHKGHNGASMKKDTHKDHKHNQPREQRSSGGHGHSHGDLNMRGVFLHVLGDALGNIGVIGTALFIWLTDFSWRFYADPAISLVITVIILLSAIPLCKAASRILLQAVPENLSVDDIEEDITSLDGIISCHHLHVWQLSDTKLVASLHVQVDFDFKGEGSARYMELARQIRECLHEYSIHSSTIQPEFCLNASHDHSAAPSDEDEVATRSKNPSVKDGPDACLLECPDSCGNAKQCCEPGIQGGKSSNGGSSS